MEPERTPANFNRVVVQTEQEPQTAGELIPFWRTRRGLSQLELSLDANVSTTLGAPSDGSACASGSTGTRR